MKHPILSNTKSILFYCVDWFFLLIVLCVMSHFFDDVPLYYAVLNSISFCFPILFIGLALWYPVAYTSFDKVGISGLLLSHVSSAIIVICAWVSISYYLRALLMPIEDTMSNAWIIPTHWQVFLAFIIYNYIIVIYYLLLYYNNFKNKLTQESDLKNLVKESELKALKSQINPHFLFNSLNSVSALTLIDKYKAREMIINLSDYLRYSIGQELKDMNSLENELNNSLLYLEIEKIRFGDKLILDLDVNSKFDKLKIPNLILQPIFENAIKYGVYESIDPVRIMVNCTCSENMLKVKIINDYDPDSVPRKGEGIGLKNIQERLILLYGRDDLLYIRDFNTSFEVNIHFPQ